MAIALRGSATTGTTTVTAPTGVQTGDVLIAVSIAPSATTITVPSGWTTVRNVTASNSSTLRMVVAYMVYSSGTTWTFTGATYNVCSAYSGCNPSTPLVVENYTAGGGATTITTPSVNNTVSGAWRVCAWGVGEISFSSVSAWSTFSPADTIRNGAHSSQYAVALTDSNAAIATGNTSVTGTLPSSFYTYAAAIAWIGILNSVAPTAIAGTDTGSGSDAGTVGAAEAETGSGADTAAVTATVPISETGSGADTAQQAAQIPSSDTGSGSEGSTAAAQAADTGGGAESAAIAAQVPIADTGTGADTLQMGMSETDTGTDAADVAVIAAGATDAGSGADTAAAVAAVAATDTGSGADTGFADIQTPATDAGSGADSASIAVVVPTNDAGSGTDTTGAALIHAGETGDGSETVASELTGMQVPPDMLTYRVPPAYRVPA